MKIIIFGVGRFYQDKKKKIPPNIEIIAFIDNNPNLRNKYMDNRPILSPCDIKQLAYDKIVLMSDSEEEMKNQLLKLDVFPYNIWNWSYFFSKVNRGILRFYCGNHNVKKQGKKILIISTDLNYNGGTIAALYATKVLQEQGNIPVLAAPDGDDEFIREAKGEGINIVLCPALPYLYDEEMFWIQQFDVVLVNVFQMALCACKISKIKPVVWWIHEPDGLYKKTIDRFQKYLNKDGMSAINIYAVSSIAQRNFNFYFPGRIERNFPYGIPDKSGKISLKERKDRLCFALIGTVCPRKAQDIYINAIKLLDKKDKRNVDFWIIGFIGTDEYSNQIKELASKEENIKIIGMLTRNEIQDIFKNIDVVVCPSLEDPLPIVVTEGWMYGKTCIVSTETGSSQYINNKKNGLVCKTGSTIDLCEKMKWVIHNSKKLPAIGNAARQIYEKYFSFNEFGKRLETVLQDSVDKWTPIQ